MNENKEYKEVVRKDGIVRRVPTSYHKPHGKKKTVSVVIPITLNEKIEQIAKQEGKSKSEIVTNSLLETLGGQ